VSRGLISDERDHIGRDGWLHQHTAVVCRQEAATLLELAVLDGDEEKAIGAPQGGGRRPRSCEPVSTLQTLQRLRLAREQRGPVPARMAEVEYVLEQAAAPTRRSTFGAD
jgi:hypothetical protein